MQSDSPRGVQASAHGDSRVAPGCEYPDHRSFPLSIAGEAVDTEPVAIQKVSPVYPDRAREANVDGTVIMRVLVCEHGRVIEARIKKSIAMLDASAFDSVRRWRFTPATRDGKNVSRWIDVPLKFTLN